MARHRALVAAARIACGSALVGCPAASTTAPQPTAAIAPASLGPEAVAACNTVTAAAFAGRDQREEAPLSADVLACCQTIAADYDGRGLTDLQSWSERTGCCSALEWQGSAACTPWGPPTPPEMTA